MHKLFLALMLVASLTAAADGTVTSQQNLVPTSWKISTIHIQSGVGDDTPMVAIEIIYFNDQSKRVSLDRVAVTSAADLASYFAAINSPAAGESGTAAKKHRQRVTKWLIDNGKINNVTAE